MKRNDIIADDANLFGNSVDSRARTIKQIDAIISARRIFPNLINEYVKNAIEKYKIIIGSFIVCPI